MSHINADESSNRTKCGKCGVWREPEGFPKSGSPCKPCRAELGRAWRRANPERSKELSRQSRERHAETNRAAQRRWRESLTPRDPSVTHQVCTTCKVDLDAAQFSLEPANRSGLRSQCKSCRAGAVAAKREARPERHILTLMIQRCHNPNNPKFHYWGGRGISVCPEWRDPENGFTLFFEHIGPKPSNRHSVDRIDNDGNYEPGNVRWATQREQIRNSRPRGSAA